MCPNAACKNSNFQCKQTLIDKRHCQFSLSFSFGVENMWAANGHSLFHFDPLWHWNVFFFMHRAIQAHKNIIPYEILAGRFSHLFNMSKIIFLHSEYKCIIYTIGCSPVCPFEWKVKNCTQHRLYVWCLMLMYKY